MSAAGRLPKWAIAIAVVLALVGIAGAYLYVAYGVVERQHLAITHNSTIVSAIKHSDEIIEQFDDDYPEFAGLLAKSKDPKTYAIPGLVSAKNIRAGGDGEGEVDYATDMTPQGVAVTERYVIVSAYCESKDFHSVLWVIDKHSRDFIKTVVLDGTDHVGGIAYDDVHGLLWVAATAHGGRAAVGCLSMDAIEDYDFDEVEDCLHYERVLELSGIERTSFVSYYDNLLFAGCFYDKKDGVLCCYAIGDDGLPTPIAEGTDEVTPMTTVSIPDEIQGMAFCDGMIMLSQSYGPHDARLLAYEDVDVEDAYDLTDNVCLFNEAAPPYMEQICAEGTDLYVVFESSASKYRSQPGILEIDHVLKLDFSEFAD